MTGFTGTSSDIEEAIKKYYQEQSGVKSWSDFLNMQLAAGSAEYQTGAATYASAVAGYGQAVTSAQQSAKYAVAAKQTRAQYDISQAYEAYKKNLMASQLSENLGTGSKEMYKDYSGAGYRGARESITTGLAQDLSGIEASKQSAISEAGSKLETATKKWQDTYTSLATKYEKELLGDSATLSKLMNDLVYKYGASSQQYEELSQLYGNADDFYTQLYTAPDKEGVSTVSPLGRDYLQSLIYGKQTIEDQTYSGYADYLYKTGKYDEAELFNKYFGRQADNTGTKSIGEEIYDVNWSDGDNEFGKIAELNARTSKTYKGQYALPKKDETVTGAEATLDNVGAKVENIEQHALGLGHQTATATIDGKQYNVERVGTLKTSNSLVRPQYYVPSMLFKDVGFKNAKEGDVIKISGMKGDNKDRYGEFAYFVKYGDDIWMLENYKDYEAYKPPKYNWGYIETDPGELPED